MSTKQKNFWYVLVLTNGGPVFVTGEGEHKTCFWNDKEPPLAFGEGYAKDMAFGLTVNGHVAFAVCSRFELDSQPYRYKYGHFKWQPAEETEEEENDT